MLCHNGAPVDLNMVDHGLYEDPIPKLYEQKETVESVTNIMEVVCGENDNFHEVKGLIEKCEMVECELKLNFYDDKIREGDMCWHQDLELTCKVACITDNMAKITVFDGSECYDIQASLNNLTKYQPGKIALNENEVHIVKHALGLDHKDHPYRNKYNINNSDTDMVSTMEKLKSKNIANTYNGVDWWITNKGMKAIKYYL